MNESVNERRKFLNWRQLVIVLKPFQYVHFKVCFTENLKNREKQTKKVTDSLCSSDNANVLMEFFPGLCDLVVGRFFKDFVVIPYIQMYILLFSFFFFFAGNNASLFLFCN